MTPAPTSNPQGDLPASITDSPAFVAILTGEIPGVFVPGDRVYPSTVPLGNSPDDLEKVGLMLYVASDQKATVVYNPTKISAEELQAADQEGKLEQILPEYGQLTGEQPQPTSATASMEDQLGAAGAPSPQLPPPQGILPPPPPSAVSKPLNRERVANLTPGPATTGPKPGAGRLANMLATSAV